jgi:hypothetical protein
MLAAMEFSSWPRIDCGAMTRTIAEIFHLKRWLSFAGKDLSRRHTLSQDKSIFHRERLCKETAGALAVGASENLTKPCHEDATFFKRRAGY